MTDLQIDKDTRVVCKEHPNDGELKATYVLGYNKIVVEPCQYCLSEAQNQGVRLGRGDD